MQGGQGRKLILVIAAIISFASQAQEIIVKGGFVEEDLLIGQDINYWLTATYPVEMEMIFPDSNYTFLPFEYSNKTFFPTELRDSLAFDSTVYTLQSFEIDPVQYLTLNAVVLSGTDSIVIASPRDSIVFTSLAPVVTDSTKLKTNLNYLAVYKQFNYPLLYYILGGVALLTIILLLIFGKKIIRYFKLRKLEKDYKTFTEVFYSYVNRLKENPEPDTAEKALIAWKNYQQKLDKEAFSTFTTKEILDLNFTSELEAPLKSIDRTVYGKRIQESIYQDFEQIEDFTEDRFTKKVEEIKHGK